MKLVTYLASSMVAGRTPRLGALVDQAGTGIVVDLVNAVSSAEVRSPGTPVATLVEGRLACRDMLQLIESWPRVATMLEDAVAEICLALQAGTPVAELRAPHGGQVAHHRSDSRLLPPLRPVDIIDAGNYEDHLSRSYAALGMPFPEEWREIPNAYRSGVTNLAGPDDEIQWPRFTEHLDYEVEVACVIGRRGKDVPVDLAGDHIFGYTIFNDLSARDQQAKEAPMGAGPFKSKNFEGSNILGPSIVTADEVNARELNMWARCNGELWTAASTSGMYRSFEELLAYLSVDEVVQPGQLIASGTPEGGCSIEHGKWLTVGDVIELEVESLGVLSNRIVPAQ